MLQSDHVMYKLCSTDMPKGSAQSPSHVQGPALLLCIPKALEALQKLTKDKVQESTTAHTPWT